MDDVATTADGQEYSTLATPEDFRTALQTVLREARANDVDVRGGWVVHGDDGETWDVEITRVVRDS